MLRMVPLPVPGRITFTTPNQLFDLRYPPGKFRPRA
jgi:hypothetical protein